LGAYYNECYNAYRNVSFSPDKRAVYVITTYSKMLEEDIAELEKAGGLGNYVQKFTDKFLTWMSAKSRCASSMITGPANFPVRKMEKAWNSEHNRMNDFFHWREKYFKAVHRVPTKSPEEELILAEAKLEKLRNMQLKYRQWNIDIRKSKITAENEVGKLIEYLLKQGYEQEVVTVMMDLIDHRGGKWKIPSYVLTNNNAKIKSTETKVKAMLMRIERKKTWEDIQFEGGYLTLEDDRFKIFHDEKPDLEVRKEIKRNGFRWSPHWGCWCRKHTGNAVYAIRRLSFISKALQND